MSRGAVSCSPDEVLELQGEVLDVRLGARPVDVEEAHSAEVHKCVHVDLHEVSVHFALLDLGGVVQCEVAQAFGFAVIIVITTTETELLEQDVRNLRLVGVLAASDGLDAELDDFALARLHEHREAVAALLIIIAGRRADAQEASFSHLHLLLEHGALRVVLVEEVHVPAQRPRGALHVFAVLVHAFHVFAHLMALDQRVHHVVHQSH